jgi:hypothetical protein
MRVAWSSLPDADRLVPPDGREWGDAGRVRQPYTWSDERVADPSEAVSAAMNEGSALLFLGSTHHGGGTNRTADQYRKPPVDAGVDDRWHLVQALESHADPTAMGSLHDVSGAPRCPSPQARDRARRGQLAHRGRDRVSAGLRGCFELRESLPSLVRTVSGRAAKAAAGTTASPCPTRAHLDRRLSRLRVRQMAL